MYKNVPSLLTVQLESFKPSGTFPCCCLRSWISTRKGKHTVMQPGFCNRQRATMALCCYQPRHQSSKCVSAAGRSAPTAFSCRNRSDVLKSEAAGCMFAPLAFILISPLPLLLCSVLCMFVSGFATVSAGRLSAYQSSHSAKQRPSSVPQPRLL